MEVSNVKCLRKSAVKSEKVVTYGVAPPLNKATKKLWRKKGGYNLSSHIVKEIDSSDEE